eukprot:TRINITY_DN2042_c0_g1_i2.p1 TRINITY_DN2042_c0_g1~~TRINITY_DN2042_c0_g1_i2.p1  ORF type:complete len:470 (+),score=165.54 TRINITY_DN2042_c0_g1_i2:197-1606(+)
MAAAAPSAASSAVRGSRLFNVGRRGAVLPLGRAPRAAAAGSLASSARVDRRRLLGLASGAAAGAGYQRAPRPGLSVGPVGLADAASSTPPAAFAAAPARRRLSSTDGPTFPPPKEVIPGPATALSEEEALLQDMVAKFAARHVAPLVASMDVNAELDATLLTQLFEAGLMGVEVPAVHGGGGMSFTSSIIVIEELAKVDAAVSAVVDIHNTLLCNAVRRHGDEAQQAEWLPRLATTSLGAFCLSEAGSGSDAFALKTTAVRDGGGWVLNGTKAWISNAKEADIFLVFANADPAAGHRGITAFLVDRAAAGDGLVVGKKEDKLGIRASSCCELSLDGLRVPAANVLGPVGQGYKIAIGGLNEGRVGIGAQLVGLAQGALDVTLPYTAARRQFGRPVADNQGMQFQFAQAATELAAARALVYNAARLVDAGLPAVADAAYAKLFASQVADRVAASCINWAGGVGVHAGLSG